MLTCKSPRKVMRAAHALGSRCLRTYSSKFSRRDYTLPQLFACLVEGSEGVRNQFSPK